MASHNIKVTVESARGLRPADVTGTSDPFAEVYIGDHRGKPRGGRSQKTSTIKHTLNPRWNESFSFTVKAAEISSGSLVVKLMDWDRFTRNDKLGYFVTPLSRVVANPYQDAWFPLTKNLKNNMPDQGSLHLIISVDGKGPSQPGGAAPPYQPQYGTQPSYMGGGQPMVAPQQPPQLNKYSGLGTTGFTTPAPSMAYPPPTNMPGYPPQQAMPLAQPYGAPVYGYPAGGGGWGAGQQPPVAGYPQQAAAPYGGQPPYGQPPCPPQQQQQQGGLWAPASYIPSFRPQ